MCIRLTASEISYIIQNLIRRSFQNIFLYIKDKRKIVYCLKLHAIRKQVSFLTFCKWFAHLDFIRSKLLSIRIPLSAATPYRHSEMHLHSNILKNLLWIRKILRIYALPCAINFTHKFCYTLNIIFFYVSAFSAYHG